MISSLLRYLLPRRTASRRMRAARRLLPGPLSRRPGRAARTFEEGTLETPGFRDIRLENGQVPWAHLDDLPRAHLRQLHGHAVLRDLVHGHRRAGCVEFLESAVSFVDQWIAANPREAPTNRMAWHDETTAMRVQSWLLLREELIAAQHTWRGELEAALGSHAALLADESFHTTGTNHGMFQDEALVTYASLVPSDPSTPQYFQLGTRRLLEYFDLIVTPDGVHREHSPSYHVLVAGKIRRLARFYADAGDSRTSRRLSSLRSRMARYATHVITPAGSFPLIGDTFTSIRPKPGLFDDPAYRWAATRGREGTRPTETNVVFPDAGYAIFRDAWREDGRGTYVHFTAAYHTDYHKHSDDLSVWLYHDGDLLTEAGPNGYDYADPFTSYGYSAHAHNTLLVDDESLPRVDERAREVRLTGWDLTGDPVRATARNGRFDDVVHERTVELFTSDQRIVITDRVASETVHRYTLLWNCAPGVTPELEGRTVRLRRGALLAATLAVTADHPVELHLVRGDIDARRGFRLGGERPEPTWTVEVTVSSARAATIAQTIDLDGTASGYIGATQETGAGLIEP